MCDHENTKCIKTTGEYYLYKCFDCGEVWEVDKNIKPKKKTLIEKIFKRKTII